MVNNVVILIDLKLAFETKEFCYISLGEDLTWESGY